MSAHPPSPETAPEASAPAQRDFFVVGIGASAGGLEALSEVLRALPRDSRFAVVIVQHLDPNHESILVEILGRVAALPVQWAADGVAMAPGNIYVAPARACLGLSGDVLELKQPQRPQPAGSDGMIDFFFRSLAAGAQHRAVGVILSGTGTDGTAGLKAIKAAGGIALAQDPETAAFPAMPRAAIEAGQVDRVLPCPKIGDELVQLTLDAPAFWRRARVKEDGPAPDPEAAHFGIIFRLLAARTGVDFADYKQSTIRRRIVRRVLLTKSAHLAEYVNRLQRDRDEIGHLYESLLINVTEFFRDPDMFDFLSGNVLPEIVSQHHDGSAVRVWVPGCSTGEEVYSLAILLRELLEDSGNIVPVQIFATDISNSALTIARAGVYSASDVAHVLPSRLARFFTKTERGYIIPKAIRDMCIFARQNVTKDSPFSRLDLISCRNLLIYLGQKLQRRLMPVFHYALNPGGHLVLGSSESVSGHAELYRLVDRRFRVYTSKPTGRRTPLEMAADPVHAGHSVAASRTLPMTKETSEPSDIIREADRIVLNRSGSSGVLINDELDILQFRGDVSPYLAPVEGRASLNLLKMAREGLADELQEAVDEARSRQGRIRRGGVSLLHDGSVHQIEIDVTPVDTGQSNERFFLVLFTPAARSGSQSAAAPGVPSRGAGADGAGEPAYLAQIDQLRHDLQSTRRFLQSAIEKHETANQELRAANEEIQSSNEELQSTNEELETAKEELQSTNEELTTVNDELHSRQLELIHVNNDLHNLINSVQLPIIILGSDMCIRRFTPMAEKVFNLIPTDVGRPFSDINTNLQTEDLPRLTREVAESVAVLEREVQDRYGRWYSLRLRPYRTAEQKIDGVVLTAIDIDVMKRTMAELEEARDFARAIIEVTREPLAALDAEFRIKTANESFYRLFDISRERAQDRRFFELVENERSLAPLRAALEGILPTGSRLTDFELGIKLPRTGAPRPRLLINARRIASVTRSYPLILISLRSVD